MALLPTARRKTKRARNRPRCRAAEKRDELAAFHGLLPRTLRAIPSASKHSTSGQGGMGLGRDLGRGQRSGVQSLHAPKFEGSAMPALRPVMLGWLSES